MNDCPCPNCQLLRISRGLVAGIIAVVAMFAIVVIACGCTSMTGPNKLGTIMATKGGVLGAIQTADEALAVKYGVSVSVVKFTRKMLGIPDARTLPNADQVLPASWTWAYDMLDGEGKVVDISGYHYGDTPRLRKAGSLPASVFTAPATASDAITLESVLSVIGAASAVTTNQIEAFGARLP